MILDEWILRYEADQQLHLFTSRFYSVTTIRYDWWQQTSAAWRLGYARLVGSGQIRRTASAPPLIPLAQSYLAVRQWCSVDDRQGWQIDVDCEWCLVSRTSARFRSKGIKFRGSFVGPSGSRTRAEPYCRCSLSTNKS